MTRPLLAMISHYTDGSEQSMTGGKLERGVHLRWGFRRELGFPLGGFCVYRRESRIPTMLCAWLSEAEYKKGAKQAQILIEGSKIIIRSNESLIRQQVQARWIQNDLYSKLGTPVPQREISVTTLSSEHTLQIELPLTPYVLVEVLTPARTRINAKASSDGRVVTQQTILSKGSVTPFLFAADRIDTVDVYCKMPQIVRVCIAQEEPCDDKDYQACFYQPKKTKNKKNSKTNNYCGEWQLVSPCPICLPVSHPDYPCPGKAECDEAAAQDRLPKDRCTRAKYGGENLGDLLEAVRTVVDRSRGPTMGSRFMPVWSKAADCAPPKSRSPNFRMPALDMLLTASIDPVIARVLGLYIVDGSRDLVEDHAYDYKIIGYWPEGTLWSLDNVVGFDDRRLGSKLPPGFKHEELSFVADSFSRVVPVQTNFSGVTHALQLQEDFFDWDGILPSSSPKERQLYVHFKQNVGEVQVYAQQRGGGLTLSAYHNGEEVATTNTTNRDALLAVHAPAIDAIKISRSSEISSISTKYIMA